MSASRFFRLARLLRSKSEFADEIRKRHMITSSHSGWRLYWPLTNGQSGMSYCTLLPHLAMGVSASCRCFAAPVQSFVRNTTSIAYGWSAVRRKFRLRSSPKSRNALSSSDAILIVWLPNWKIWSGLACERAAIYFISTLPRAAQIAPRRIISVTCGTFRSSNS